MKSVDFMRLSACLQNKVFRIVSQSLSMKTRFYAVIRLSQIQVGFSAFSGLLSLSGFPTYSYLLTTLTQKHGLSNSFYFLKLTLKTRRFKTSKHPQNDQPNFERF
jgi:hypothetical protein